jgi:hypothetical protein
MRPAGDVAHALLNAAAELASPGHGGTLRELAARACVGRQVAGYMVPQLKNRGLLEVVAERAVPYRNRPIFEYAPAQTGQTPATAAGNSWRLMQDAWRDL